MFNNPFDSFRETAAKAKQEREQLDRLLTISTPGELALVALTASVLLLFSGWLLFGSVARSVTADGVLVESGESLPDGGAFVQALVRFDNEAAQQIDAGLPAVLEVAGTDGETHRLKGRVAAVAAAPVSEEFAPLEAAAPLPVQRIRIALDESLDFAPPDGAGCRIVIELGSQAPLAFLTRRPS